MSSLYINVKILYQIILKIKYYQSSRDVIKTQLTQFECMNIKSNHKTEFRKDSAVSNLKLSNMFQAAQILNLKNKS